MYNNKIKLAVICNSYDLIEIMRISFERENFIVKFIKNDFNILEEINDFHPQLVIIDLDFSDMARWDLLRIIKDNNNSKPYIIAISGKYTQPIHIIRAINDFYADDYLIKPFPTDVLMAKIKSLLRRTCFVVNEPKGEILRHGPLKLDIEKMEVSLNTRKIDITNTEFKILYELIKQKTKPVSRKYLKENIMGYFDYGIEARTIDKHIASIRKKLKTYGKRIVTVTGVGYKFC